MRIHNLNPNLLNVLGPGNRFVIWTQGCPLHCAGCMTKDSWSLSGGYDVSVEDLMTKIQDSIRDNFIEGLTISGGEPFIQAKDINILISNLSKQTNLGVIVYTGFTIAELHEMAIRNEAISLLLNKIDLLIDGRYVAHLDDGKSLRGSSNQKVIYLTDRYKRFSHLYGNDTRVSSIKIQSGTLEIEGLPSKAIKSIFKI